LAWIAPDNPGRGRPWRKVLAANWPRPGVPAPLLCSPLPAVLVSGWRPEALSVRVTSAPGAGPGWRAWPTLARRCWRPPRAGWLLVGLMWVLN